MSASATESKSHEIVRYWAGLVDRAIENLNPGTIHPELTIVSPDKRTTQTTRYGVKIWVNKIGGIICTHLECGGVRTALFVDSRIADADLARVERMIKLNSNE